MPENGEQEEARDTAAPAATAEELAAQKAEAEKREQEQYGEHVARLQALFDAKIAAAQAWADRHGGMPKIVITVDDVKSLVG